MSSVTVETGQAWSLRDDDDGETIVMILDLMSPHVVRVLVLSSSIKGCQPGTTEQFSMTWFTENGSLLSQTR